MNSNIELKIRECIKDLCYCTSLDRKVFFETCVQERLDKSLEEYAHALNISLEKLNNYGHKYNLTLIKRLSKEK